jgi:hypothetical protein
MPDGLKDTYLLIMFNHSGSVTHELLGCFVLVLGINIIITSPLFLTSCTVILHSSSLREAALVPFINAV